MGEKNGSSALTRIEQFKDNETEQVWELFKNEFRDASRQLDGELGWMLVSGGLGIEDVNKQMPKEIVAKLVADVAMSANSTVPFAASWISNGDLTGGQLTDAGVLLADDDSVLILTRVVTLLLRTRRELRRSSD